MIFLKKLRELLHIVNEFGNLEVLRILIKIFFNFIIENLLLSNFS